VLGLATGVNGQAAQHMPMSDGMELVDQVPPDKLPPPRKISGIGNAHIPITASREVQEWFDQGLNLYHDFWTTKPPGRLNRPSASIRSCAMCYWGLGRAEAFYHSNSQAYAKPAYEKAASLIDHVSDREQLYLRAMMADAKTAPDILRTLVQRYPDDVEAQFLLAPSEGAQYVTALERILKAHAGQFGRQSRLSSRAREAATILSGRGTARTYSGGWRRDPAHGPHAWAHLLPHGRTTPGRRRRSPRLERVDERYMRKQHVDPDNDWNYVHNLMYAVDPTSWRKGSSRRPCGLGETPRARGVLDSTLYTYSTRDSMSRLEPRLPVAFALPRMAAVLELMDVAERPRRRAQPRVPRRSCARSRWACGRLRPATSRRAAEAAGLLDAALPRRVGWSGTRSDAANDGIAAEETRCGLTRSCRRCQYAANHGS